MKDFILLFQIIQFNCIQLVTVVSYVFLYFCSLSFITAPSSFLILLTFLNYLCSSEGLLIFVFEKTTRSFIYFSNVLLLSILFADILMFII